MREYTTIIDTENEQQSSSSYYLCPIGTQKPEHFILCSCAQEAHSLKLSLGLGTQPDPTKAPHYYERLESDFNNTPVYKVLKLEEFDDSWSDPGCCESGCNGCPWKLRNLGAK